MRIAFAVAVCSLVISGCAGLAEKDCRSDWYQTGLRDGQRGDNPRAELERYAAQCRAYGVQPDAERYRQGWQDAFGELRWRTKGPRGA